jgi:hypothetical protein
MQQHERYRGAHAERYMLAHPNVLGYCVHILLARWGVNNHGYFAVQGICSQLLQTPTAILVQHDDIRQRTQHEAIGDEIWRWMFLPFNFLPPRYVLMATHSKIPFRPD